MTKTADALRILDNRIGEDNELRSMIAQERHNLAIAQLVYDARIEAHLTQSQLASLIGTRQPVIARLEDADYGSQSLTMLHRIAQALSKRLEVSFVSVNEEKKSECERSFASV